MKNLENNFRRIAEANCRKTVVQQHLPSVRTGCSRRVMNVLHTVGVSLQGCGQRVRAQLPVCLQAVVTEKGDFSCFLNGDVTTGRNDP